MLDIQALIPLISGVVSAAVQIGLAANKWWQNQKSERAQQIAFAASSPTTSAAKDLNSLMDVQAAYWKSNPGMWQALGVEAASMFPSDEQPITSRLCAEGILQIEWVLGQLGAVCCECA